MNNDEQKPIIILFKTVDGFDVFDEDEVYYVGPYFHLERVANIDSSYKYEYHIDRTFYEIESARQWIFENNPCLSAKEVQEWLNEWQGTKPLTDLVKSKL